MPRGAIAKRSRDTSAVPAPAGSSYAAPYFNALAADVTQNAGGTSTLATLTIPAFGLGKLTTIFSSWCVQTANGTQATVFIDIDGVTKVSGLIQDPAQVVNRFGADNWAELLTPGAHTIRLRVNVTLGTIFCRAALVPLQEFANLTVVDYRP